MKQINSAGESRRSRRRALNSAALVTVGVAVLLTIGRGRAANDHESWNVGGEGFTRPDDVIAAHLLQSVNGANPVLCAAVDRGFNTGSWGMSIAPLTDSIPADAAETARWIGRNHIDRSALEVAKRGLASGDACTRRTAARIAGNVDVKRLDEQLSQELSAAAPATRVAAIMALGYAGESSALARLRALLDDSDRGVRLASLWALGAIEDESVRDLLVKLLETDKDPEVRRLSAWALGKILDH